MATDKIIEKMEKEIAKEYRQAHKEVSAKLSDYLKRYIKKDETWRKWVEDGKKTAGEYTEWLKGQVMMGKRWKELKDNLADDYVKAHNTAEKIAQGKMAEVYAVNHNYATFEIEKAARMRTSYTLYSKESVERMWREHPKLYKKPGTKIQEQIRNGELKRWNRQQIQSVMTQGILQGESIPNLAKRLESVTGGEHGAAIRNARTMMTGVQNAGRMDAYTRANDMGIETQKTWVATLDSRTRHAHRELDGQTVPIDEPFEVDGDKIMFPGDPDAEGYLVYNCRCTLISSIKGHEIDVTDMNLRHDSNLGDMTYEEWLEEEESTSYPITHQEEVGRAMKYSYIREYRGG